MSDDPVIARLSRLTPDGSGLDRDALLFAAGRASARPDRRLRALAGLLAASQLLTLGLLLWPGIRSQEAGARKQEPGVGRQESGVRRQEFEAVPPAPEASESWALRNLVYDTEGNLPHSVATESLAPLGPPLRAFGAPPSELLH